jgi:flagellar hook-basal body complex protein FliE
MRVNSFNLELGIQSLDSARGPSPAAPSNPAAPSSAFGDELMSAMSQLDQTQRVAEQKSLEAAQGGGNVHEVALALEQADVTLKVAVKARNKIVEAYQEIMRMQV